MAGRSGDHGYALEQEVHVEEHGHRDQAEQTAHDGGVELKKKVNFLGYIAYSQHQLHVAF